MGEEAYAFCRLKNPSKPLTNEELKNFCKGNLAHFKIPKHTIIVDEFPRTQSGKIQKHLFLEYFKKNLENIQ